MLSKRQRFEVLALDTNRQYAHAVVYGGLTEREASLFSGWVVNNAMGAESPADNLALFLGDDDDGHPDGN